MTDGAQSTREHRQARGAELRTLAPLLQTNPAAVAGACVTAITQDPQVPDAYSLLVRASRLLGTEGNLGQVAEFARSAGLDLIIGGLLSEGAAFLAEVAQAFPDTCGPYAALYRQVNREAATYRHLPGPPILAAPDRNLVIALSVFDERELEILTRYAIPSMLAPRNLPALCRRRAVQFALTTTAGLLKRLRAEPAVRALERLGPALFSVLDPGILPENCRAGEAADMRHWVAGARHYVAMERARALGADLICTAPGRIVSDSTLARFADFVDEGYQAVLTARIDGQAEALRPMFDDLRAPASDVLVIAPRRLAGLAAQNLHQSLKDCVLVPGNDRLPQSPTQLVFPHAHGFRIRSIRLQTSLLAAEAIRKHTKSGEDGTLEGASLEANFADHFFCHPQDWTAVKVVDDSDDGMALDLVYDCGERLGDTREISFDEWLRRTLLPRQFWQFEYHVNVHGDSPIEAIGTFDRDGDGSLRQVSLPIPARAEANDLDTWLDVKEPALHAGAG